MDKISVGRYRKISRKIFIFQLRIYYCAVNITKVSDKQKIF